MLFQLVDRYGLTKYEVTYFLQLTFFFRGHGDRMAHKRVVGVKDRLGNAAPVWPFEANWPLIPHFIIYGVPLPNNTANLKIVRENCD